MVQSSPDQPPLARLPEQQRPPTLRPSQALGGRSVLFVTWLYTLCLLSGAAWGGFRLYDWAREGVLRTAPNSTPIITADTQPLSGPAVISSTANQPVNSGTQPVVSDQPAAAVIPPVNILLLGVDARSDDPTAPRTDTMILATVDPQAKTVSMLSLPRDLWVTIPYFNTHNKINMAYVLGEENRYEGGGPQLAKDTVSAFIGRPVDYYLRINFQGFVTFIDQIGGIEIAVPSAIHDEQYPTADYGVETFELPAGLQTLDGETTLKYARTRHTDSDFGRARRQQDVIRAVLDKALRADMLPTLIGNAPSLFTTLGNSIETDMPWAIGLQLANFARVHTTELQFRQLVLDDKYGTGGESADAGGAWILLPDPNKVRIALAQFFSPPPPAQVGVGDDLSGVRVEVLNGSGEPGIARLASDLLQARGWRVVSIGDADRGDYSHTLVVNYGIPVALINQLSADLRLPADASTLSGLNKTTPVDIRIVIGRDLLGQLK